MAMDQDATRVHAGMARVLACLRWDGLMALLLVLLILVAGCGGADTVPGDGNGADGSDGSDGDNGDELPTPPVLSGLQLDPPFLEAMGGDVTISVTAEGAATVTAVTATISSEGTEDAVVVMTGPAGSETGAGTWTGVYAALGNAGPASKVYEVEVVAEDVTDQTSDPVSSQFIVLAPEGPPAPPS